MIRVGPPYLGETLDAWLVRMEWSRWFIDNVIAVSDFLIKKFGLDGNMWTAGIEIKLMSLLMHYCREHALATEQDHFTLIVFDQGAPVRIVLIPRSVEFQECVALDMERNQQ
jgi:hypothetical protein